MVALVELMFTKNLLLDVVHLIHLGDSILDVLGKPDSQTVSKPPQILKLEVLVHRLEQLVPQSIIVAQEEEIVNKQTYKNRSPSGAFQDVDTGSKAEVLNLRDIRSPRALR